MCKIFDTIQKEWAKKVSIPIVRYLVQRFLTWKYLNEYYCKDLLKNYKLAQ